MNKCKVEIGWKKVDSVGNRIQVEARKFGGEWRFYSRPGRHECWEFQESPPLEDWLELLDALRRRMTRRLTTPDEIKKLERVIKNTFPEFDK